MVSAILSDLGGLPTLRPWPTFPGMRERGPLTIDMTPGGAFVPPPRRATWPLKVGLGAAALAAVAGALALAALFLWVASVLLPVALIAAAVAYAAFRFQRWRLRH